MDQQHDMKDQKQNLIVSFALLEPIWIKIIIAQNVQKVVIRMKRDRHPVSDVL